LFDDELNFQPPIRELSWEDERLCLPTGHLAARLVGDTPWVWWVWDSIGGAEILRLADPELVNRDRLAIRSFFERESFREKGPPQGRVRLPTSAALAADLEAVRTHRQSEPPALTYARVVYELGERVLGDYEKRHGWQRFAAFVQNGGEPWAI
jgi:hypothetical protein